MKIQLSSGFLANAEYVKLGFLDKNSVELGSQFEAILPILWMKAGSIGNRPKVVDGKIPDIFILTECNFAVLIEEASFAQFKREVIKRNDICYVYLVTDSQTAFEEMAS